MAKKVEDYGRKTIKKGIGDIIFDIINVIFMVALKCTLCQGHFKKKGFGNFHQ